MQKNKIYQEKSSSETPSPLPQFVTTTELKAQLISITPQKNMYFSQKTLKITIQSHFFIQTIKKSKNINYLCTNKHHQL
jgi:hypothetical protein